MADIEEPADIDEAGPAVVPTVRVVDGSLNNSHILKDVTLLSTNINSDKVTADNNNANTRAHGQRDNSMFDE